MAFPESWKEEVLSKNDIVDVVSAYVELKRRGNRYWGLCPFHREKTPSFSVLPEKGIFYCFSCHKGGDAVKFIMEMEKLSYPEAMTKLAERAGMEMPTEQQSREEQRKYGEKKRLYALMKDAARRYFELLASPEGRQGLDYLRERGITDQSIRRFGIGYAPASYTFMTDHLLSLGYTKKELVDANIARSRDGRVYDVFRERAMFPIIDKLGRVIAFGGRLTGQAGDDERKYLNSSDTLIYNKRRNLFGLNLLSKLNNVKEVILAEGYVDVVSLSSAGIKNAVASLGTALTREQAVLLKNYGTVFISYDGDAAGVRAALRAIPIIEGAGLQAKVIRLPGGLDPDDYVRKYGRQGYIDRAKEAVSAFSFALAQKKLEFDTGTPDGMIDYATAAAGMIAAVENHIERERYIRELAAETGISENSIRRQVEGSGEKGYKDKRIEINSVKTGEKGGDEEKLLSMLIARPELVRACEKLIEPEEFAGESGKRVYNSLRENIKAGILPKDGELLQHCVEGKGVLRPEDADYISALMLMEERPDPAAIGVLAGRIRRERSRAKLQELEWRWSVTEDAEEKKTLLAEISSLSRQIRQEFEN